MVRVFIWSMQATAKQIGHASIQVQSHYMSWWPDTPVQLSLNSAPVAPIRNKTYASDVSDEGSAPNHTISINGLEETEMIKWWQGFAVLGGFHGPVPPYQLTKMNCSSIVAQALKVGGGDKHAGFFARRGNFLTGSEIWTPTEVLSFAKAIQKNIK